MLSDLIVFMSITVEMLNTVINIPNLSFSPSPEGKIKLRYQFRKYSAIINFAIFRLCDVINGPMKQFLL